MREKDPSCIRKQRRGGGREDGGCGGRIWKDSINRRLLLLLAQLCRYGVGDKLSTDLTTIPPPPPFNAAATPQLEQDQTTSGVAPNAVLRALSSQTTALSRSKAH
jgi:hypothetical protein